MNEIKEQIDGEIFYVYKYEDPILSRCQFFPNWCIDHCNPNQNYCMLLHGHQQTVSKVYMERQKTQNS